MKEIFRCVDVRLAIVMFASSVLYSVCDSLICKNLSELPQAVASDALYGTLIMVGVCCLACVFIEWVTDMSHPLVEEKLYSARFQYFMDRLYGTKTEVLKKSNTGYISSLTEAFVAKQYTLVRDLLVEVPIALGFVGCCVWMLWPYSKAMALGFSLLYLAVSLARVFWSEFVSKKANVDAVQVCSDRDRFYIDTVSNISTVQRMSARRFALSRMESHGEKAVKVVFKADSIDEVSFILFKYACYAFIPVCLVLLHNSGNAMLSDPGFVSLCVMMGIRCPHNGRAFYRVFWHYGRFKASMVKVQEVVNDGTARKGESEAGGLKVTGLDYTYDENGESRHIVVPEFEVCPGDIICVHGESGQGKTTLLGVLSGEIESDCIEPSGSRAVCTFIAQDTEVLDMSLWDNLTMGQDLDRDYVSGMLVSVGLGDWLSQLKDGMDTVLGERGVFVSTGQRQRINLVRGLLLNKGILLLDEPTSNLDDATEGMVVGFLEGMLEGRTAVIVTHRDAVRPLCNKGYKFEGGVCSRDW